MKKMTIIVCTMLITISCKMAMAQDEAAMQAWQDYMTPGDVHKMLAAADGEWTEDITMWMAPGQPPSKSTATAQNKMILGGRYQESTHKGSFNGMPFEGIGVTGYDNAKKMFTGTWIDNMGTGIMYMEGKWDPAKKVINFSGTTTDPSTGKEMKVKETFTLIDDNTQKMEMYMVSDGQEFKTMEIMLKRK